MRPSTRSPSWTNGLISVLALALQPAAAFQIQSAPSPDIDISQLGRVAFAGDFDSISLYNYIGQNEDGLNANGSQYVFGRYPDGGFAKLGQADASISSMCAFMPNNKLAGVIVGGNFTSLGHQQSLAAALMDPNTLAVTPLPGLNGQINTVLCDGNTVYIGGAFAGLNSTNAISWTTGWTNLPFSGFNGPVHAIDKMPNGNILYGGSFSGLGSVQAAPRIRDAQVVNVGSANISSYPNTTRQDLADPRNIICRTGNDTSPGWLLDDQKPGFWRADFGFTFRPTKLRLYQTQERDYGTKTWRYTFYPTSGIANFTYFDDRGQQYCQADCPLPNGNNTYQDFYFVNNIPMMGFRIDVLAWYGKGGGLGGIELFQDDIWSYAVQNFNEPNCDHVSSGSNSTASGSWNSGVVGSPGAMYLSSYLLGGTQAQTNDDSLSVNFMPDLEQSGNYSIQIWTPGCLTDNSCASRGTVNVTGLITPEQMSSGVGNISAQVTQTNNYDKYDEIYYGFIEANNGTFKPRISLTPTRGQNGPLTVVAWKVQFVLRQPADSNGLNGSLNGLFEYDPRKTNQTMEDSAISMAGTALNERALVSSLAVVGNDVYAAGNFSSRDIGNVLVLRGGAKNATALPNGGLNNAVQAMSYDGQHTLFLGGNFTSTLDNATQGLNNVAAFDTQSNQWQPLGAGLNGVVFHVVPISINISRTEQVDGISFSGYFNQIRAFGSSPAIPVSNIAIWIPSHRNWIQNLGSSPSVVGQLTGRVDVPGSGSLYAGVVDYQANEVSGVMGLTGSTGNFALDRLSIHVQPRVAQTGSMQTKRATTSHSQVNGVVTGVFYNQNGLNLTILGGHFTATASNGSTLENLVFINGSDNNQVNGIPGSGTANQAIVSMDTDGTTLYAGGNIPNGFIQYDMSRAQPATPQPPALQGGPGTVQAIARRPSSSNIYFGGDFQSAGSLLCAAFCRYDSSIKQWNTPAPIVMSQDSVVNVIQWYSDNNAILAGNMTIGGNRTTMVRFDDRAGTFTPFAGSGDPNLVPGPIATITPTDDSYTSFFAAGVANNGSAFVLKFSSNSNNNNANPIGGSWQTAIDPINFGPATLIQSVQTMPAANSHSNSGLVDSNHILLVTGMLQTRDAGNVSAATFDGQNFRPFILSSRDGGDPGSIRTAFVQNPGALLRQQSSHRLALGLVVLIALALALACVLILTVLVIAWEKYKRHREGYVLAPTVMPSFEKSGNIGGITARELFGGVQAGSPQRSTFED